MKLKKAALAPASSYQQFLRLLGSFCILHVSNPRIMGLAPMRSKPQCLSRFAEKLTFTVFRYRDTAGPTAFDSLAKPLTLFDPSVKACFSSSLNQVRP